MIILQVKQKSVEWLNSRRGKIMGSNASSVRPLKRKGKDGTTTPTEMWRLLGEVISQSKEETIDEMSPTEWGNLLEAQNAELVVQKYKLPNPNYAPGTWFADNGLEGYSPDTNEDTPLPRWVVECKSFDVHKHLTIILAIVKWQKEHAVNFGEHHVVNALDDDYKDQVIQGFVVNPKLQVCVWSMYAPQIGEQLEQLRQFDIVIYRKDVEDLIAIQHDRNMETFAQVKEQAKIIAQIAKTLKTGTVELMPEEL